MCKEKPIRFVCETCGIIQFSCEKCGMDQPHRTLAGKPKSYFHTCEECQEGPPLKIAKK